MKNKALFGIFIVLVGMIISLGYLYNQQVSINEDLTIDNSKYKRDIAFKDSINNVIINTNLKLDSVNKVYEIENANIKWSLEQVEEELNDAKNELENMSIEAIAKLIIKNHLGNTYKIKNINDTIFVAFEEITVRDIAEQDIEFEAEKQRSIQYRKDIAIKDTLIKIQKKSISILNNTNNELLNKQTEAIEELKESRIKIVELTNDVNKQKSQKRIAVVVSGVLLGILIIL